MSGLPDGSASRVVLVGTHRYESFDDLPSVRANLTGLRDVFTDARLWGLPDEHCAVVEQPVNARQVLDQVRRSAERATDTLIVYFAGHGFTDDRTNDLCLALPDSEPGLEYTMLPFDAIRRRVLDHGSRARRKVVILDCCFSARALQGWMGSVADQSSIEGSCVLTASSETRMALAPPGEKYTAFTGELINVLETGVPGGPSLLDMETVYQQVRWALEAKSRPIPQQRNRNAGGQIPPVINTAASLAPRPAPPVPFVHTVSLLITDVANAPRRPEAEAAIAAYVRATPHSLHDPLFLMPIEDVFVVTGRGVVVTGRVERGQIGVGMPVDLVGGLGAHRTTITGVEMFRKTSNTASMGENVGLSLGGVKRAEVEPGMVVTAQNSVMTRTHFQADIYLLPTAKGGRQGEIFNHHQATLRLRTANITATMANFSVLSPGESTTATITLTRPTAIDLSQRFTILDNNTPIGAGQITGIIG
ncbi:caspase family protein [Actinokineospora auranticolor]|nr:EF-Tu/IF-2/RF-3 family GTPase [Actinokineospora auranticolor]